MLRTLRDTPLPWAIPLTILIALAGAGTTITLPTFWRDMAIKVTP